MTQLPSQHQKRQGRMQPAQSAHTLRTKQRHQQVKIVVRV